LWYWRQTVVTILVQVVSDVRARKLATMGALATGFAVWAMFESFAYIVFNEFTGAVWIFGHLIQGGIPEWFWWCWWFGEGLATAWLIGVLCRSRRASMTAVFAVCFVALQIVQVSMVWPRWQSLFAASAAHIYLLRTILHSSVVFAGILTGGIGLTRTVGDTSPLKHPDGLA